MSSTSPIAPILPGSTIGVLGSGQLGRMFALAARQMGYRVHTFSPDTDTPTGQVADKEYVGSYDDLDAVRAFAREVQVVTFEFENVPAATADAVAEIVPVRPNGNALHITQNRLREKTWLAQAGLPHAPFRAVHSLDELKKSINALGSPAILKTAGFGYDGKGQVRMSATTSAEDAWSQLGMQEAVLEAQIEFDREFSVVAVRGSDGDYRDFGNIQNSHKNGILDISVAGHNEQENIARTASEIARAVLEGLDIVGVLCVEFFQCKNGELLINELAPRPHNSGHLTIDSCVCSQFEQQLRAICGLPLGSTEFLSPAAMTNLLGDIWADGEPKWGSALAIPKVALHLYGKEDARPGRKMGHLTALASTAQEAEQKAHNARDILTSN